MREYNVTSGRTPDHSYRLMRRHPDLIAAGAAPYVLYVDEAFYCTCESREQADEEIAAL